jgi:hypothetical protein
VLADGQRACCAGLEADAVPASGGDAGLWCYAAAGLLAWPAARLVAVLNRWQGAGVLLAVGMVLYAVGDPVGVLHRWVLTDDEKQKGYRLVHRGLGPVPRPGGNGMNHFFSLARRSLAREIACLRLGLPSGKLRDRNPPSRS